MDDYFLMNSYSSPCLILGSYLVVLKYGPTLMKSRQPYDLKLVLVLYNVSQIIYNFYLFLQALSVMTETGILCTSKYESTDEMTTKLLDLQHKYIVLKAYDLFDTVFFILRKKEKQVSFLHVYHHFLVFLLAWAVGKHIPATTHVPAGPPAFYGAWNTFVHTVMYTYYLLSAILGDNVKNSLWKKYVTLLQLIQHFSIFTIAMISLLDDECPYPRNIGILFVVLGIPIIYMFSEFYFRNYIKKTSRNEKKEKLKN